MTKNGINFTIIVQHLLHDSEFKMQETKTHDIVATYSAYFLSLWWKNKLKLFKNTFLLTRDGSETLIRGTVLEKHSQKKIIRSISLLRLRLYVK
jgi:hypothetical protein